MSKIFNYYNLGLPHENRKVLKASFSLERNEMLEILKNDYVKVLDKVFIVPDKQILEYLINKKEGEIELELIEVKH